MLLKYSPDDILAPEHPAQPTEPPVVEFVTRVGADRSNDLEGISVNFVFRRHCRTPSCKCAWTRKRKIRVVSLGFIIWNSCFNETEQLAINENETLDEAEVLH